MIRCRRDAGHLRPPRFGAERHDRADQVVVLRVRVGNGGAADVRRDDGRAAAAATVRYSGSAKPLMSLPITAPTANAALATDARHVSTEIGHVEPRAQRVDRRHDAIELFGFADLVAGTGLHAADVEEVGTVDDELLGLLEEVVESVVATLVEERVGRAVQDAPSRGTAR